MHHPSANDNVRIAAGHVEGSTLPFARAFFGSWKPVRRSLGYRLSLLASAAFMLMVPLMYLAAVAGVCWLAHWHFLHDTGLLQTHLRGRAALFPILLYVLPGLLALAIIVFMLQPLLALFASDKPREGIELFPSQEPRLFAFVGMVCTTMGAPVPNKIYIDCEANAAAQLMGGGLGLLFPRGLALHIGMPLVAGMNATSLAAVLAHEFGHFSQGAGMRATGLLDRMSHWMATAAYRRGSMDAMAQGLLRRGAYGLVLGIPLVLCIWVARLVMMGTFLAGFFIAQLMRRRMEFDADAHAANFVGSKAEVDSWPRLIAVSLAMQEADAKVAEHWKNRRLPIDMPAMVAAISHRQTPELKSSIKKILESQSTGWRDSHPAIGQRIKHSLALNNPGIFRLDEPARNLFTNFEDASRSVSYAFFKQRVGEMITSATFVPWEEIFGGLKDQGQRATEADSYLGFEIPDSRPLWLELAELTPPDNPAKAWAKVREVRAVLREAAPIAAAATNQLLAATTTLRHAEAAPVAFQVGLSTIPKDFGMSFRTRLDLPTAKSNADVDLATAASKIDPALDAARSRVTALLRLLAVRGVETRVPDASQLRARAQELLLAHQALRRSAETKRAVDVDLVRASLLASLMSEKSRREKCMTAIRPVADNLRDRLSQLRMDLGGVKSPFPGPDADASLGAAVAPATPGHRQFNEIFEAGVSAVRNFDQVSRAVVQELISIASRAESALEVSANAVATARKDQSPVRG